MPTGMVLSVLLHLAIALFAVFGLPFIVEPPPPVEEAIPVELAPLAEKTTAPPPKSQEQKPPEPKQEVKQPEPPKPEPPKPEPPKPEPPKPQPPPPQPPAPTPPPAPAPPPPTPKAEVPLPAPEKKPEPPKPEPPKDQLANIKPPEKKPPPPKDDFDSLLKTLDKMKQQPKTDKPPDKKPQKDDLSDLEKTLQDMQKNQPDSSPSPDKAPQSTPNAEISLQPTMSEISMVQHQVEIHWNFDVGARDAANLIVQVHVTLQPDGTVTRAELVPDPRYDSDTFFRSAADSARRAVLAASPLKLPPNSYEKFKDFTFRFDPRNAVR
jgi:hypothetical protein